MSFQNTISGKEFCKRNCGTMSKEKFYEEYYRIIHTSYLRSGENPCIDIIREEFENSFGSKLDNISVSYIYATTKYLVYDVVVSSLLGDGRIDSQYYYNKLAIDIGFDVWLIKSIEEEVRLTMNDFYAWQPLAKNDRTDRQINDFWHFKLPKSHNFGHLYSAVVPYKQLIYKTYYKLLKSNQDYENDEKQLKAILAFLEEELKKMNDAVVKEEPVVAAAVETGEAVAAAVETGEAVAAAVETGEAVTAAVETGEAVAAAVETGETVAAAVETVASVSPVVTETELAKEVAADTAEAEADLENSITDLEEEAEDAIEEPALPVEEKAEEKETVGEEIRFFDFEAPKEEPVNETVAETAIENVSEAVTEPVVEAVSEMVEEPVVEAVSEMVEEPVAAPIPVPTDVEEITSEPVISEADRIKAASEVFMAKVEEVKSSEPQKPHITVVEPPKPVKIEKPVKKPASNTTAFPKGVKGFKEGAFSINKKKIITAAVCLALASTVVVPVALLLGKGRKGR